jgi:2-methylisocitrate lyase-like PEP mutase family enzyme
MASELSWYGGRKKEIGMAGKGEIFRALHQSLFVMPNPWDIGTARILAALGFKALATTSAGMAFALGLPDGGVPRDLVLDHCRAMVAATSLPVSADLEKGFGDTPESTAETIRAAAATGLAGGSIEDHTGHADNPIFDFALSVERIAAASEAARQLPDDFVLTARCENLLHGRDDMDDTIKRLQAYEMAGADVLYAPGLRDLDTIRAVCGALTKPVNVLMGLPGVSFGTKELAEAGVKRISVGSTLTRAAFNAFIRGARGIVENGRFDYTKGAIGSAEIEGLLAKGAP